MEGRRAGIEGGKGRTLVKGSSGKSVGEWENGEG